jgi:hypothetical protein
MLRRWLGLAIFGLILSFSVSAVDDPVVLQPGDPAYTPSQRATLLAELETVDDILSLGYPVPKQTLIGRGWTDGDFARFAGGTLRSFGYEVVLVEDGSWPDGVHTWILAGISVGERTAWVPVEASVSLNTSFRRIGFVPWASGSGTSFDGRYLRFDSTRELPVNRVPTVTLTKPGGDAVINETTTFLVMTRNDDGVGRMLAIQWVVDGEVIRTDTASSFGHIFAREGKHTVEAAVIDDLGGRALVSMTFDVLKERLPGCSCG